MKILLPLGYLRFHRKEQWDLAKQPYLICHWHRYEWMSKFCNLVEKRIFYI